MRTIKPSDITPGMTIRWDHAGVKTELTVRDVSYLDMWMYRAHSPQGMTVFIPSGTEITVLEEPQPPEPTEFDALVVVDGVEYIRWDDSGEDRHSWASRGRVDGVVFHCWDQLTARGQVRVIRPTSRDNEEEN